MTDQTPADTGPGRTDPSGFIRRNRGWGGLGLVIVVALVLAYAGYRTFGHSPAETPVDAGAATTASVPATAAPQPTGCAHGVAQDIAVSGAVSGTITCARSARCGNVPANHFGAQIAGVLDGGPGTLYIRLDRYTGPGTYASGSAALGGAAVEFVAGHDWQSLLASGAAATGALTVDADGRSGTIDAALLDADPAAGAAGAIRLRGTWHCG